MRQDPPPIGRVRSARTATTAKPKTEPRDEFPVEALLMSFDSWISNAVQKFRVPAARIRQLIHEETKPGMAD